MDRESNIQPELEAILDRIMKKCGNHASTKVLIKWARTTSRDNTWESLWKLRGLYPHLMGKVLEGSESLSLNSSLVVKAYSKRGVCHVW